MVSSKVVYRDAVVDDGPGIARVWVAAWQAAYAGLMPAAYLESLNAELALPAFEVSLREGLSTCVVEVDGGLAGFAAYGASRDPDAQAGTGEVIAINLHPLLWRQGFGRELLAYTVRRLARRGYQDASLWVLQGNVNARRFYEALGWQADGAEKRDNRLTGFTLHEVRYRMALNREADR